MEWKGKYIKENIKAGTIIILLFAFMDGLAIFIFTKYAASKNFTG